MNLVETTYTPQEQGALISVIIPVYNVEKYLAECLESAMGQTFTRIEIICVDDCSTDGSLALAQQYAQKDKRIKILTNAQNSGLAASRNVGIRNSDAPFIMFMDSDDTYDLGMCEKMYDAIVASNADVAMCGIKITYECNAEFKAGDDDYYALKYTGTHKVNDEIMSACDVSACNKIFRRALLEKYELKFPDGMKYEDAYFFNAYMAHARIITFVNEQLYHYRRREGSIMNQTFARNTSVSTDHLRIAFLLHAYYVKWKVMEDRYAYFCKFLIDCMNFAIWNSPSEQEKDDILCMAGDFVRKNVPHTKGLEQKLAITIEQLRHVYPTQTRGFIFQVKTKPLSRKYLFLGIPLYRIKYTPKAQKHYLLGVQVYRKKCDYQNLVDEESQISHAPEVSTIAHVDADTNSNCIDIPLDKKIHLLVKGENNTVVIDKNVHANSDICICIYGSNNHVRIGRGCHHMYLQVGADGHRWTYDSLFSIGNDSSSSGLVTYALMEDGTSITIGEGCIFSWDIAIRCTDDHALLDELDEVTNKAYSITIGDKVWIGYGALVLKNTNIPDGCVIGARSVVTRKFCTPNCAIAGNPAKVIKENIRWHGSRPDLYKLTHYRKNQVGK